MAIHTREIGKMISYKEKDSFSEKMERNMKVIGFRTRCKVLE